MLGQITLKFGPSTLNFCRITHGFGPVMPCFCSMRHYFKQIGMFFTTLQFLFALKNGQEKTALSIWMSDRWTNFDLKSFVYLEIPVLLYGNTEFSRKEYTVLTKCK